MFHRIIILCVGIFFTFGSLSASVRLTSLTLQEQASLVQAHQEVLDKQISGIHQSLVQFSELLEKADSIIMTPDSTYFEAGTENGQKFIALQYHEYVPVAFGTVERIGDRITTVKLFLSGNKLSKIETKYVMNDFYRNKRQVIDIIDNNPNDTVYGANHDHIRVKFSQAYHSFAPKFTENISDVTLAQVSNTVKNPLQNDLKKEYYVPHLLHFERSFTDTLNLLKKYSVDNSTKQVSILIESTIKK